MSSAHVFTVKDVCSNNEESGSTTKSGTDVPSFPLASSSPTSPDPTLDPPRRLPVSFKFTEASNNQQTVVTQSTRSCNWQSGPGSSTSIHSPFPLDLVYELWHTYVATDEEESGIVLSLETSADGDIFGVGKRPVQREIEKDGCIQLVFVKE